MFIIHYIHEISAKENVMCHVDCGKLFYFRYNSNNFGLLIRFVKDLTHDLKVYQFVYL